jgi:hypothetical protein
LVFSNVGLSLLRKGRHAYPLASEENTKDQAKGTTRTLLLIRRRKRHVEQPPHSPKSLRQALLIRYKRARETHKHKNESSSRIPGGETGKPKRTSVDGLLLRLYCNLALARDLPSERRCLSHDSGAVSVSLTPSDDAAGHAPRGSLLRAPHAAREHKLHRAGLAHRTREPLRAATASDRADVHLGLAELGVGRREKYVCHQRELAPASELRRTRTSTDKTVSR